MEPRSTGLEHQTQPLAPPENLHHVWDDSPKQLIPGEIIVLNKSPILRSQVEPDFFAVLACPRCGILNLIAPSQYFGASPIICVSNSCPCSFRIEDESRIVYQPLN